MRRPGQNSSSVRYFSGRTVTLFNLFLFCTSLYLYLLSRHSNYDESVEKEMPYDDSKQPVHNGASLSSSLTDITSAKEDTGSASASSSVSLQDGQSMDFSSSPCSDPVWCDIPMPKKSYFNFDPPTNIERWKLARLQAAAGEQVLLKRIAKVFPSSFDFLDGDIGFRRMHYAFDFFVDDRRDLTPLTPPPPGTPLRNNERLRRRRVTPDTGAGVEYESRRILQKTVITGPKMVNGKLYYPWELEKKRVIPDPYDFRAANRSAVVSVGYTAYTRDSNSYFTGNRLGAAYIDRNKFFDYWKQVKDNIDLPFIAVCIGNENWGMLSTMFPNRTAGWGRCCDTPKTKIVWDFLNHEKTLMLVTNQHVNMSHPKLLVMPRGIPLTWGFTRFIVWDAIRNTLKNVRKQTLLFAAASNWGPRPQILRCISAKVPAELFDGHINTPKTNRLSREMYYQKLGSAMFGVGLPGLGYDTFRAWELMTMGTIVVLEKAVGFDRTMHRLPALFLEDFDLITPSLLREAYVEALYRADDFEYERLTQNFWYGVIANVSATMSVQTILDKFPMSAEEPNFARPREPYDCGKTNTCGQGVKRTPRTSC